ncbi:MAG TPA: Gfo/Idh/MocA family oxidoreductase [Caulobacteraceae bacterium]|jgi:predicted dehydrogenase
MIGIAVIGYGYWGPNLARCIDGTPGCRLAAIVDPSPAALERARTRFGSTPMLTDWREALARSDVDAVAVSTPVRTHFEISLAALESGRHVLVEKPMTETSADARQLIEAAERRGLTLLVDHTFIYSSAVQKMRELIAGDELGEIFYYDSTRVNLGLFQSDVNVLWDLAVHDLSILQHVLDSPPTAISANAARHIAGAPESMGQVTLYLANGAVAHLNVNWLAPVKVRKVLIGGSRKMIVWDDLEPSEKIKVYDCGVNLATRREDLYDLLVSYRIGDMWAPRISTAEPLLTEIKHFADCIEAGAAPITGGWLGLHVVEMLEAASRSIALQGHPIALAALRRAS